MIEQHLSKKRRIKLKILQINANYGFSSTGVIVKDIGEAIINSSNEAFFAYQKTNVNLNNGFVIGNELDWKIHAVLCRLLGGQGYFSTLETYRLIKKIKNINPDVVHLHNLHSNYLNINVLFKFLSDENIATVITMHDCWYFTGKCFHYIDYKCDKYKIGCGKCPKKNAPPKSYIFDWSKYSLKNKKKRICNIPRLKIVGCSEWICKEAKKGILSECDFEVIHNGVDISVFKPVENSIKKDFYIEKKFLVMGMANKWLLNENIEMLEKVSALPEVVLMIVGCNNEQKKNIDDLKKNIIAIGFIEKSSELAKYYSAADVFVNLTHADTLPTVNMESICCGTPVITYNSCGSPELIDSETGIVVEENNKEGILEAINYVRNNKFTNCRQVGTQKFDKDKCYQKYIRVYNQLMKTENSI